MAPQLQHVAVPLLVAPRLNVSPKVVQSRHSISSRSIVGAQIKESTTTEAGQIYSRMRFSISCYPSVVPYQAKCTINRLDPGPRTIQYRRL